VIPIHVNNAYFGRLPKMLPKKKAHLISGPSV
jgi:hypothetical protein